MLLQWDQQFQEACEAASLPVWRRRQEAAAVRRVNATASCRTMAIYLSNEDPA